MNEDARLRRRRERAMRSSTRRQILRLLEGGREVTARVLCEELAGPPISTVSYHLSVLAEAELVEAVDGVGTQVYSRI